MSLMHGANMKITLHTFTAYYDVYYLHAEWLCFSNILN